jgi:hypothetical protein
MIKLISAFTGTVMWVHESRVEEYLRAGHKLAPLPTPPQRKTAARSTKPKAEK